MRKQLLLAAVAALGVALASPALAQPKDIVDTAVAPAASRPWRSC